MATTKSTLLDRYSAYQQEETPSVHEAIENIYMDLCIHQTQLTTSKSAGIFGFRKTTGIEGDTLLSWLQMREPAMDEKEALVCGQRLLDAGYISPGSTFDPSELYEVVLSDSPSLAGLLRREKGVKQGQLHLSTLFAWKAVHVVCTSKRLALYATEYASEPLHQVMLEGAQVHDVQSNPLAFRINPGAPNALTLVATTEVTKKGWIDVLVGAGAMYFESTDLSGIGSFFDLKDRWMNGQEAPMAEYRGKVCLVVNVASF